MRLCSIGALPSPALPAMAPTHPTEQNMCASHHAPPHASRIPALREARAPRSFASQSEVRLWLTDCARAARQLGYYLGSGIFLPFSCSLYLRRPIIMGGGRRLAKSEAGKRTGPPVNSYVRTS